MFEQDSHYHRKKELPDWLDNICQTMHNLDENQSNMLNIALLVAPVVLYLLLSLMGFGVITKFMIVALLVSVEALLYSFKVLAWLLNLDDGTPEMKEVANTIVEGSEGFFKA